MRFHTSLKPTDSGGLITVEIAGVEPKDLADWLWAKHRIFVTPIEHDEFKGIRVTPNVYTTVREMDRFGEALRLAAKSGIA